MNRVTFIKIHSRSKNKFPLKFPIISSLHDIFIKRKKVESRKLQFSFPISWLKLENSKEMPQFCGTLEKSRVEDSFLPSNDQKPAKGNCK